MLPFPQLVEYGNTVIHKEWYDGVDLIAYDSSLFSQSGFTDYTGKTVSVITNPYGQTGSIPTKGTQTDLQYGTGINMNRGSIGAANSQISTSYLTGDWMCDLWVKYTTIGSNNDYLPFYPLMNDSNGTGRAYEFQSRSDTKYFAAYYNNGTSGTWVQTANTYLNELKTGSWHHFCMQYTVSTSTLNVYVDGIIKIIFTGYTPVAVSGTTHNGFLWGNYVGRSSASACVERYRLRTGNYVPSVGIIGSTAFNPDTQTLYPNS